MAFALGIDCSTQSLTGMLLDAADVSAPARTLVVPFGDFPEYGCPRGFREETPEGIVHADPRVWLAALDRLLEEMKEAGWPLSRVGAVSGSAQQHGSVYLRPGFSGKLAALGPDKPLADQCGGWFSRATAPIWMDSSTSRECGEIAERAGGNGEVLSLSGSVAVERFTGPQIRAFFKREPEAYAATGRVHLVSSFLCSVFLGKDAPVDTGDGAGMNLMNLARGAWEKKLLAATAPDLAGKLPALSPGSRPAGTVSRWFAERAGFAPGCVVLPFSGDNPSSLVGMGASTPGKVVISLGTSDTLFAAMEKPLVDPQGCGHVFGNPLGGYLTLACVRNGSLAREAFRDRLGATWEDFEKAGNEMLPDDALCLPFLFDEITPKRPACFLETKPGLPAAARARAFLEGQAFNLFRQLGWMNLRPSALRLTGGAAGNAGVARVFAEVFGVPVERIRTGNSAALGAAMRAAIAAGADLRSLEEILCAPESVVEPASRPPEDRFHRWLSLLGDGPSSAISCKKPPSSDS